MYENDQNKSNRVLFIYSELLSGNVLKKKELAEKFNVNEKTIQRDLEDIRQFLDNRFISNDVHNDLMGKTNLKLLIIQKQLERMRVKQRVRVNLSQIQVGNLKILEKLNL